MVSSCISARNYEWEKSEHFNMIVQYNLVDISESKKRRIRALKWDDTALTALYSSKAIRFINALIFKISKIKLCFYFVQVENEWNMDLSRTRNQKKVQNKLEKNIIYFRQLVLSNAAVETTKLLSILNPSMILISALLNHQLESCFTISIWRVFIWKNIK